MALWLCLAEGLETGAGAIKKYRAFISYSQKDKIWARRIQKSLESYRVPLGLAVEGLQKRRLGRFFRDDDELAGASSLGAALTGAIEESESLIVIASPNAAASKWVNEEIRTFKQTHGPERVFAVIVGGRPFASEEGAPEEECFPLALRRVVDRDGTITDTKDEPLAPDVAKDSFARIRARVAAGLLGLDFDALWQRERRRRRRNGALAALGAGALAAGIGGAVVLLDQASDRAALQESRRLAEQAQGLLDAAQPDEALRLIVQALPQDLSAPERPVAPEAMAALTRAMAGNIELGVAARLGSGVEQIIAAPQGALTARLRDGSFVRLGPQVEAQRFAPDAHMGLTAEGMALRAFSEERNTEGGWVFDQSLFEVDPVTGERTRGFAFTDPARAWFLTRAVAAPGGGRVVVPASGLEREGELAVFDLPEPFKEAAQEPLAIWQSGLENIENAVFGFAGPETLVLFQRGEDGGTLLRWPIGATEAQVLVPEDAGGACPPALSGLISQPHVTVAPDGGSITMAAPTGEFSWCVTSWDSGTGAPLHQIHAEDLSARSVQPLSAERWLALPGGTGSWDSPVVLSAEGERWELEGCDGTAGIGSLVPDYGGIAFLSESRVVCSDGSEIRVIREGSVETVLTSHSAEVTALSLITDGQGMRQLWSGDAAGVIRAWDMSDAGDMPEPGRSRVPLLAREEGLLAVVSAQKAGPALSVWSPGGEMRLAPVPVPPLPAVETPGSLPQMALEVLGGKRGLITQAYLCPISLADAPETECSRSAGRALLFDLGSGAALAQVEGLARGGARLVPVALSEGAVVFLRADGGLRRVNVSSGAVEEVSVPPEGALRDIAFVGGALWASTAEGMEDRPEGDWRLYRLGGAGWELMLERKLTSMTLHPAPGGQRGVALGATLSEQLAIAIGPEGIGVEGTGGQMYGPLVIQPAGAEGAILLSDQGAVSLEAAGQMPALPALSLITGYDFKQRVRLSADHAVLVWLGAEGTRILRLPEGTPLCSNLALGPASDAVFSADGGQLAINHGEAGQALILDLASCAVLRSLPSAWEQPMIFAGDHILWQTAPGGQQVITRPADPAQMLRQARQLVERMQ
ncbi:TIR domain-containing protein [Alphaproteobacteria bacterium KMM 3653]|uniref:TIR domain-containing protein n=1 Tax=Harenicola maris TaxID=2841044 RepID=A0AAP2G4G4_9RHOB|nr:TIR domain-containing protein [Harenicola maris]